MMAHLATPRLQSGQVDRVRLRSDFYACRQVRVLLGRDTAWGELVLGGIGVFAQHEPSWFLEVCRSEAAGRQLRGVDGVIACGVDPRELAGYAESGVPVVAVTTKREASSARPTVLIDEQACGQLGATHFQDRQYGHYAYLSDEPSADADDALGAGYRATLGDTGRGCDHLALPGDQPLRQRISTVCTWLRQLPKPVAVLGYDANHAQLLVEACRRLRIRIPDAVGILSGEDDVLAGSIASVSVSGIDRGYDKAGRAAGQMLADHMDHAEGARRLLVVEPVGIIERESTDTVAVDDPEVAWAIRYIREHISEPIQVSDVVAAVGLSRRALEKRFMQALGHTPGQEIRRWRLKKVQKLLAHTQMPIQEVAAAAGFVYAEVMQRTFKRHMKMVPTEYRQRYQTGMREAHE